MSAPVPTTTVLVVEDDDAHRALVCEVLEASAYRVLAARNGLEAMQINKTFPDRIALVILDMALPLMSGLALAERLRKKRPFRMLLMSGQPAPLVTVAAQAPDRTAFIQKPFTAEELLGRVREVLR
jgi:DNA-binding response OmpR family regulator